MELRLDIENSKDIFSAGDEICGIIHVLSTHKTAISELTATLIGESTSSLTGSPGLLFSRRETEKHTFIHEEHQRVFSNGVLHPHMIQSNQLGVGCHSFPFRLQIPLVPECSACPPNSPVEEPYHDQSPEEPGLVPRLPPSTTGLQDGNEVTYRINVTVVTMRNMFKSRTSKSFPITVWPLDARLDQFDQRTSVTADITARATILGPSSVLLLSSCVRPEDVRPVGPAEIQITASFQPDFQLTKLPCTFGDSSRSREVYMDLAITKFDHHPHDLYLQSFQMLLVGYTDIHAGAARHGHMSFWTLQSLSNVGLQIFSGSDLPGSRRTIDPGLWKNVELNDFIVPDFSTCNLRRRYELEVSMGWQCRSGEHAGRVFFVQLRTPVRIASGIRPSKNEGNISISASDNENISSNLSEFKEPGDEYLQGAYFPLHAPPTYDEAVRNSVIKGPLHL